MTPDSEDIRSGRFSFNCFQLLIGLSNHWPWSPEPESEHVEDILVLPYTHINAVMIREMLSNENPIPNVLPVAEVMRTFSEIFINSAYSIFGYPRSPTRSRLTHKGYKTTIIKPFHPVFHCPELLTQELDV